MQLGPFCDSSVETMIFLLMLMIYSSRRMLATNINDKIPLNVRMLTTSYDWECSWCVGMVVNKGIIGAINAGLPISS